MLKLFLWLRYLGKKRVVLLSVAAVAVSCALLIVVASLFTGFIDAFKKSSADVLGDVILSAGGNIEDYPELIRRLEGLDSVEAATGTLSAQGLLHLGRGNVRAVEISGIDLAREGKVTAFEKSLFKRKTVMTPDPFSAGYVGIGVLVEPNERTDEYDFNAVEDIIGQTAVVTTGSTTYIEGDPSAEDRRGRWQFRRRTIQFRIAGAVFSGVYINDKRMVYLPIERVQEAVYPEEKRPIADKINIKLKSGADAESAAQQIRGSWGTFAKEALGWSDSDLAWSRVETAGQMQARFLEEVRKQMWVLLVIFGAISMSAVLLVFCIFYMIVETKRRDIAILKSCGSGGLAVATIFLGFGGCIGLAGAAIGTLLGCYITKNINMVEEWIRIIFGLKLWKASVYMFSKIPDEVAWGWVLIFVLLSVIAASLGALLPAMSAALTRPVNILRYE